MRGDPICCLICVEKPRKVAGKQFVMVMRVGGRQERGKKQEIFVQ